MWIWSGFVNTGICIIYWPVNMVWKPLTVWKWMYIWMHVCYMLSSLIYSWRQWHAIDQNRKIAMCWPVGIQNAGFPPDLPNFYPLLYIYKSLFSEGTCEIQNYFSNHCFSQRPSCTVKHKAIKNNEQQWPVLIAQAVKHLLQGQYIQGQPWVWSSVKHSRRNYTL